MRRERKQEKCECGNFSFKDLNEIKNRRDL
jgi:hypothetical protein